MTIAEVPSMELERRAGDSNLNAWTDGKRVLKTLFRERLTKLSRRDTTTSHITLQATLVPAHSTDQWLPAGSDTGAQPRRAEALMQVLVAGNGAELLQLPVHTLDTAGADVATAALIAA
jgi:hypothetical protein